MRHAPKRLNHVIHRKMGPLVNLVPEFAFDSPQGRIGRLAGEFIVDIHLAPADLIDDHQRSGPLQAVQLSPERTFFFLNGQLGDFADAHREVSNDLDIF